METGEIRLLAVDEQSWFSPPARHIKLPDFGLFYPPFDAPTVHLAAEPSVANVAGSRANRMAAVALAASMCFL